MKEQKEPLWQCPLCGSESVEILVWVKANGYRHMYDEEVPNAWCPDCAEHVELINSNEQDDE